MDGQNTILSVIGPIATTARSLTLLFKSVLSQKPWYHDPLVVDIPWRESIVEETRELIEKSKKGSSSLTFGIIRNDGAFQPHPPVARGLAILEQSLKRLGHKVRDRRMCMRCLSLTMMRSIHRSSSGKALLTPWLDLSR